MGIHGGAGRAQTHDPQKFYFDVDAVLVCYL